MGTGSSCSLTTSTIVFLVFRACSFFHDPVACDRWEVGGSESGRMVEHDVIASAHRHMRLHVQPVACTGSRCHGHCSSPLHASRGSPSRRVACHTKFVPPFWLPKMLPPSLHRARAKAKGIGVQRSVVAL